MKLMSNLSGQQYGIRDRLRAAQSSLSVAGPMTLTFKNAPLAEMIAEIRWAGLPPNGMPQIVFPQISARHEELFMRFGGAIYQHGFERSERMVPPGFPSMPGQITFRYHKGQGEALQIGPNVFSANGMPPYKSWDHFRPTVEIGLNALATARAKHESGDPYNSVALRYINIFNSNLLDGYNETTFITDVLGFKFTLPQDFDSLGTNGLVVKAHQTFEIKIEDDFEMNVAVGHAVVGGVSGVLLDLGVSCTKIVQHSELLLVLDRQRDYIHNLFVGITAKISDKLQPEEI